MRVFDDTAVRAALRFEGVASALRTAFTAISDGSASVPPRLAAFAPDGMLGAMPGYVPGLGLGAKLVTYFRHNEAGAVPAHQAVIVMFDPSDGRPLALLDATYITAMRTAVAAAVAAVALSPADVRAVAVIGTGVQARAHIDAFTCAFPSAELTVAGRSAERARSLAEATGSGPAADIQTAVRSAEVVCLCTDADEPLIDRSWLRSGAHVSSVGSGREVDAATLAAGRVFVECRADAVRPFPAGSRELEGRDPGTLTEIGEVLLGVRPGRTRADEVTVYKSMGHAAEDVAAASVVLRADRPNP